MVTSLELLHTYILREFSRRRPQLGLQPLGLCKGASSMAQTSTKLSLNRCACYREILQPKHAIIIYAIPNVELVEMTCDYGMDQKPIPPSGWPDW